MVKSRRAVVVGLFLLSAAIVILSSCSSLGARTEPPEKRILFEAVDPLEKIFRETAFFPVSKPEADVARGEHATFQFAVRAQGIVRNLRAEVGEFISASGRIAGAAVGYVGYVRIGRAASEPGRDKLFSVSGYYPDPILARPPAELPPATTQPVWITVPIPKDAAPGNYQADATLTGTLDGRPFRLSRRCAINVYPPVIDRTRLWVTNWFVYDAERLSALNGGRPVEPFSEQHWDLIRLIARKMAEYRQNVVLLSPLRLATYTFDNGRTTIDFSRFDRMVRLFIEEGVIGRIEGGHIGGRESTWLTPFIVHVPELEDGKVVFNGYPITDERARNFYSVFIPELASHLEQQSWSGIYMQHLADEPIPENIASYLDIARFVKEHAPGLRLIEACHTRDLADMLDVWVPQLNFFETDQAFYKEAAGRGDEVWFYTCVFPQGEYANRFIEQPLIKTRLLHWINFRFASPGYLHWGFNWWTESPFDEMTRIQTESGLVLPGGDSWIVYPAPGGLLSSIRLEAMRDGIVDHELLCWLDSAHPQEARELARQVVYGFTQYDIHVPSFREKRKTILKMLGE